MNELINEEKMVLSAIIKEPGRIYGFKERDFETYGKQFCELRNCIKKGIKTEARAVEILKQSNCSNVEAAEIIVAYKGEKAFLSQARFMLKQRTVKKLLASVNDSNLDSVLNEIQEERRYIDTEFIEPPASLFQDYIQELDKRAARKRIDYSLPTLSRITGGLKGGELTIVAARPSVGKTMFALQEALYSAQHGLKVIYFSLEMSREQMAERIVKKYSSLSPEVLESGKLSREDWDSFSILVDRMGETEKNLMIFDNINQLDRIEDCISQFRPDVVMIDQLSKIRIKEHENSIRERFTTITGELKAFSLKSNIPIVLLAQINRNPDNEAPTLVNLKESGSIEEDADNVIMLHRKMYTDEETEVMMLSSDMIVIIGKHRNGETANFPVCVLGSRYTIIEKEDDTPL